ncbi:hypothetical protein PPACK8108_LOCUS4064 [Phakopsora pachyrhizi]|uniref:Uncharacterized protein n=1 Tax=Phakopsora pachyrhizi TaxID=170000 RepID=A0AAV0ALQ1_PHAPC|nr:hypothetical protein PPACK8108_LOCUS4064 [Phakopsora pachyrhizi]
MLSSTRGHPSQHTYRPAAPQAEQKSPEGFKSIRKLEKWKLEEIVQQEHRVGELNHQCVVLKVTGRLLYQESLTANPAELNWGKYNVAVICNRDEMMARQKLIRSDGKDKDLTKNRLSDPYRGFLRKLQHLGDTMIDRSPIDTTHNRSQTLDSSVESGVDELLTDRNQTGFEVRRDKSEIEVLELKFVTRVGAGIQPVKEGLLIVFVLFVFGLEKTFSEINHALKHEGSARLFNSHSKLIRIIQELNIPEMLRRHKELQKGSLNIRRIENGWAVELCVKITQRGDWKDLLWLSNAECNWDYDMYDAICFSESEASKGPIPRLNKLKSNLPCRKMIGKYQF